MKLSVCGIDCEICEYKEKRGCTGCQKQKGKPFWCKDGECDLYVCVKNNKLNHCGECSKFPCDMLVEWAKEGNGVRIENLRGLENE